MPVKNKILIAEDEPVTCEMLRAVLTRAGYEVMFAADGLAAVEIARQEKPDLVLSDGLLPKLHGFLVSKAIRDLPDPPMVILLTGVYTKPMYKWEVKEQYGAEELLIKPIKPRDLVACVAKYLPIAMPTDVMVEEIQRLMDCA